jgi:hypothetical protein
MVAVWLLDTVAAAAVNWALVEPAGTRTVAGTVSAGASLDSETDAPPLPAVLDSDTVQVEVVPEVRLLGVHWTRVTIAGDNNAIEVLCETPPWVAVMTAIWSVAMDPAVAVKLALVAAAGTDTAAGTVNTGLLLASNTLTPPAAAGVESVTVQDAVEPELRLPGEQDKRLKTGGVERSVRVAVCELPLYVAVMTAD